MTRKWARPASAPGAWRGAPVGRGLCAHYAHTTHTCDREDLSAGICVKRYGPRLSLTRDYFDKVLSRTGAAPATGRDTLIKLQGRVFARKLAHSSVKTQKTAARGPPHT